MNDIAFINLCVGFTMSLYTWGLYALGERDIAGYKIMWGLTGTTLLVIDIAFLLSGGN